MCSVDTEGTTLRSAWQIRAGRNGERDDEALTEGLAIVGWDDMPDLLQFLGRPFVRAEVLRRYPNRSRYVAGNWAGQLWRFAFEIAEGDLVVMPVKSMRRFAIGEVTGGYRFRDDAKPGFRHVRPARWLRTDVEANEFGADLRSSMGSLLTVCQLSRHDAPERIAEIAGNRPDPGWRHEAASVDPDATRDDLWQAVDAGTEPVRLTVRELLAKWNFSRRTASSQAVIQADLAEHGVVTRPSFLIARLDSVVELVPAAVEPDTSDATSDLSESPATVGEPDDLPIKWLVSAALPTDRELETVHVDSSLSVAITRMLATNYSQLAVVDDDMHFKGAVSWESIGRARCANPQPTLRDAIEYPRAVDYDEDLFNQIDEIYGRGYVLVRGDDRQTVVGIVTAHDLARQFCAMARPFSLVEEAELRLRRQAKWAIPEEKIAQFAPSWANGIPTFGGYGRLLDDEAIFQLMGWDLDHATFLTFLNRVKSIRNELMHFSQDTLPSRDLETIEGFVSMLRTVDRPI